MPEMRATGKCKCSFSRRCGGCPQGNGYCQLQFKRITLNFQSILAPVGKCKCSFRAAERESVNVHSMWAGLLSAPIYGDYPKFSVDFDAGESGWLAGKWLKSSFSHSGVSRKKCKCSFSYRNIEPEKCKCTFVGSKNVNVHFFRAKMSCKCTFSTSLCTFPSPKNEFVHFCIAVFCLSPNDNIIRILTWKKW